MARFPWQTTEFVQATASNAPPKLGPSVAPEPIEASIRCVQDPSVSYSRVYARRDPRARPHRPAAQGDSRLPNLNPDSLSPTPTPFCAPAPLPLPREVGHSADFRAVVPAKPSVATTPAAKATSAMPTVKDSSSRPLFSAWADTGMRNAVPDPLPFTGSRSHHSHDSAARPREPQPPTAKSLSKHATLVSSPAAASATASTTTTTTTVHSPPRRTAPPAPTKKSQPQSSRSRDDPLFTNTNMSYSEPPPTKLHRDGMNPNAHYDETVPRFTVDACGVPTFYPTHEEFLDFSGVVSAMERAGALNVGMAKVVPPAGWVARADGYNNLGQMEIPVPISQHISAAGDTFTCVNYEQRATRVAAFVDANNRSEKRPPPNLSAEQLELRYWRCIRALPYPVYGADVLGSLFDPSQKFWNVNELPSILSMLKTRTTTGAATTTTTGATAPPPPGSASSSSFTFPGVTAAYLYFGTWRSTFAWHVEDMNLYSINYLHAGQPKAWYSVPPAFQARFEKMARTLFPADYQSCHEFLRHKMSIIPPRVLDERGIPYFRTIHNPGEFMITFPCAYHSGFNIGVNVAESVNFALESWIEHGLRARICACRSDSVRINMEPFVRLYRGIASGGCPAPAALAAPPAPASFAFPPTPAAPVVSSAHAALAPIVVMSHNDGDDEEEIVVDAITPLSSPPRVNNLSGPLGTTCVMTLEDCVREDEEEERQSMLQVKKDKQKKRRASNEKGVPRQPPPKKKGRQHEEGRLEEEEKKEKKKRRRNGVEDKEEGEKEEKKKKKKVKTEEVAPGSDRQKLTDEVILNDRNLLVVADYCDASQAERDAQRVLSNDAGLLFSSDLAGNDDASLEWLFRRRAPLRSCKVNEKGGPVGESAASLPASSTRASDAPSVAAAAASASAKSSSTAHTKVAKRKTREETAAAEAEAIDVTSNEFAHRLVEGKATLKKSLVFARVDEDSGDIVRSFLQYDIAENDSFTTAMKKVRALNRIASKRPDVFAGPVCGVCGTDYSTPCEYDANGDVIKEAPTDPTPTLKCTACAVVVHPECYGPSVLPSGERFTPVREEHWKCTRCLANPSTVTACALCPSPVGAFVRSKQKTWVHASCVASILEIVYQADGTPVDLDSLISGRSNLKCVVCRRLGVPHTKLSACVQCTEAKCVVPVHFQCALEEKKLCIGVSRDEDGSIRHMEILCRRHTELAAKRQATVKKKKKVSAVETKGDDDEGADADDDDDDDDDTDDDGEEEDREEVVLGAEVWARSSAYPSYFAHGKVVGFGTIEMMLVRDNKTGRKKECSRREVISSRYVEWARRVASGKEPVPTMEVEEEEDDRTHTRLTVGSVMEAFFESHGGDVFGVGDSVYKLRHWTASTEGTVVSTRSVPAVLVQFEHDSQPDQVPLSGVYTVNDAATRVPAIKRVHFE